MRSRPWTSNATGSGPLTRRTVSNLALFPLNTVLFPGGTLPLHIFEERYRLMIGECLDADLPFGVVLIKSGHEVGGAAEPYAVGTTARISRYRRLDDGRLNLVAVGGDRFRIERLTQSHPFLRADVEILHTLDGDMAESRVAATDVSSLYRDYHRLALSLTSQWQDRVGLPPDPDALADFVAGRMETEQELKQRLLETTSVRERLGIERELLGEAVRSLSVQVTAARRLRYGGLGALN
jgi:Lon protease-like protein